MSFGRDIAYGVAGQILKEMVIIALIAAAIGFGLAWWLMT